MKIGVLRLHIRLPGCASLKEKRSRIKPLLARLQRKFNVSAAEVDLMDAWQETVIACALVSNDHNHTQRSLQTIITWIETEWRDVNLIDDQMEIL